jgi:dihydrofolate reductase
MIVSLLAAVADSGVIGRDGQLPWHLPADLRRFRRLTTGRTIVMGRKTHDAIGRPLPQRRTIVLTRQADYHAEGVEVARSLNEALRVAAGEEEVFVVGGGEIYREALAVADRMYLTIVHAELPGDVRFPEFDLAEWRLVEQVDHPPDERNALAYSFLRYERRSG